MIHSTWRQYLQNSLHVQRNKQESKFFQVASIGLEGSIENRTMVFRGFADATNDLLAVTDVRSEKYQQWLAAPKAQVCWYFSETREQFRISANVMLLGLHRLRTGKVEDIALVAKVWDELSQNAKAQFAWPAPKSPIQNERQTTIGSAVSEISENFVVICFVPYAVDYLNLSSEPQTREIHCKSEHKWSFRSVNA